MLALTCAVAAVLALALARRRWVVVVVRGGSMLPTFRDGQLLWARRWSAQRALHPRQVVVFRLPPSPHADLQHDALSLRVKRVAAVEGEPVPGWARRHAWAAGHELVPPGKLLVLGDNPKSQDSRQLGWVDAAAVVAVARRS